MDDSDPIPIETLLAPPGLREAPSEPSFDVLGATLEETGEPGFSDDREHDGETLLPDPKEDLSIEIGSLGTHDPVRDVQTPPHEEPFAANLLGGKLLRDLDPADLANERETAEEAAPPEAVETPEIAIPDLANDDFLENTQLSHEEQPDIEDLIQGNSFQDPTPNDSPETPMPSLKSDSPGLRPASFGSPEPSSFQPPEGHSDFSQEDPNLHYHLGIAYREMDLIDRAIEEFTKALDEGSKVLECLIMLSRCHFEKGLFREAADFIHRALALDNLTQDQIDMLHRQLEEAEAVGKLG
jgi:tetratricopeptide (TPR) repeat protein